MVFLKGKGRYNFQCYNPSCPSRGYSTKIKKRLGIFFCLSSEKTEENPLFCASDKNCPVCKEKLFGRFIPDNCCEFIKSLPIVAEFLKKNKLL